MRRSPLFPGSIELFQIVQPHAFWVVSATVHEEPEPVDPPPRASACGEDAASDETYCLSPRGSLLR
ncbi:MAG: hypothetical protein AAF211_00285 [Myxococcota bacterium]